MVKWEYLRTGATRLVDTLNKLGAEGWELCGIDPRDDHAVFKRPTNLREAVMELAQPGAPDEPVTKAVQTCEGCNGRGGWEDPEEGQWVTHKECGGRGFVER